MTVCERRKILMTAALEPPADVSRPLPDVDAQKDLNLLVLGETLRLVDSLIRGSRLLRSSTLVVDSFLIDFLCKQQSHLTTAIPACDGQNFLFQRGLLL